VDDPGADEDKSEREHLKLMATRIGSRPRTSRAAGGIVWRPGPAGLPEVAVIHRPVQSDWSLPKGKIEPDETAEHAALREVVEETGLRCEIDRPAGCTAYVDRKGRDKIVMYWLMRPLDGGFRPSQEVDALRWLTVDEALDTLSYAVDRALLEAQDLPDASGEDSRRRRWLAALARRDR
jgi:8-oxo-dGTP diphosphatase